MSKAKPFAELEARMSKESIARSDRLYEKLRDEYELSKIRTAAGLSQEEMARRLNVDQAQVSRIEKRSDARVSTIARYVRAAGGKLRVVADMPAGMFELKGLAVPAITRVAAAGKAVATKANARSTAKATRRSKEKVKA